MECEVTTIGYYLYYRGRGQKQAQEDEEDEGEGEQAVEVGTGADWMGGAQLLLWSRSRDVIYDFPR